MKIRDLFDRKTVFSFEVFPPKKTSSVDVIYKTLDELHDLNPDFISVTFGAGGSSNNTFACDVASKIKENGITPMIHLPCIKACRQSKMWKMRLCGKDQLQQIGSFCHPRRDKEKRY